MLQTVLWYQVSVVLKSAPSVPRWQCWRYSHCRKGTVVKIFRIVETVLVLEIVRMVERCRDIFCRVEKGVVLELYCWVRAGRVLELCCSV